MASRSATPPASRSPSRRAGDLSSAQSNIRTFPTTLPNVRFLNHHLLDFGLTKNFQLGSRVRVQVRIEALNATNYTLFSAGNVILAPTNADVRPDRPTSTRAR